jgi:hypothetical protein
METEYQIIAAPLTDGRLQLWMLWDSDLWTCRKIDASPDAAWSKWVRFPHPIWGEILRDVAVAPLSDGRLQLWVVSGKWDHVSKKWDPSNTFNKLFTCRKIDASPDAAWSSWTELARPRISFRVGTHHDLHIPIKQIAAAPLSDGRLQLWVKSEDDKKLFTCWKIDSSPDAAWSSWVRFPVPADYHIHDVAVAPLSDGRPQMWFYFDRRLFTCWKIDASPDAAWSSWVSFPMV